MNSFKKIFLKAAAPEANDAVSLLDRLKAGESNAVEEWFHTFKPRIEKLIAAKISSNEDIEDLTQQVFISCLKHLPLFRGEASIWTWMKRIAHHEIADFYRKQYAKKTIKALSLENLVGEIGFEDSHELAQRVGVALDTIRDDYKDLLCLKYDRALKVSQIAELLQRTEKSVEADLFRARRDFRLAYAAIDYV